MTAKRISGDRSYFKNNLALKHDDVSENFLTSKHIGAETTQPQKFCSQKHTTASCNALVHHTARYRSVKQTSVPHNALKHLRALYNNS